jgi:hypothetical protein
MAPRILISVLDEGEWSASRSGRFTSRSRSRVSPRAGLDAVAKRNICDTVGNITTVVKPVA